MLVKPEVNNDDTKPQCRPLLMLYSCACIHVYKHITTVVIFTGGFIFIKKHDPGMEAGRWRQESRLRRAPGAPT